MKLRPMLNTIRLASLIIALLGPAVIAAALMPFPSAALAGPWQALEPGLDLGKFQASKKSKLYDYPIAILKIDPAFYAFRLLSASEHDKRPRPVKAWCADFGLTAATNASMYLKNAPLKSTGYMRNFSHLNNPRINGAFGAFMVFNPKVADIPHVAMVDRRVQADWEKIITKYDTVIQNYRLISNGKPVEGWAQQDKIYSTAAVGTDEAGCVLFILSRAPYSTYNFIRILTDLPLGLRHAMYVEGGPEATLYLNLKHRKKDWIGSFESGFFENDDNIGEWSIPNVVGIERKSD
ncbi:MAG: phosphodiester glycosidase family protein [Deltaproteobacteria bacterium]|nr:phosphodiester glycosidase family protein [Deltaproteobacteria bacterium]